MKLEPITSVYILILFQNSHDYFHKPVVKSVIKRLIHQSSD